MQRRTVKMQYNDVEMEENSMLSRTYRVDWNIGVKPAREGREGNASKSGQFLPRKYDDLPDHGNNIISLFYFKPLCALWKHDAVGAKRLGRARRGVRK